MVRRRVETLDTSSAAASCCSTTPPVLLFYLLLLSWSITGASSFVIPSRSQPRQKTAAQVLSLASVTTTFELPSISDLSHEQIVQSPLSGSRGEIVGATGRIGSFLLRSGCGTLASTPRGVSPGSTSEPGTPIFVAVHAAAVPNIVRSTLPSRRRDLVFVTNGLPSRILASLNCDGTWNESAQEDVDDILELITLSVPHFGVLSVGGDVVTSSSSPPTFVHGRHSSNLALLLQPHGIVVEQVESISDLEVAAVKKLMWSSTMWLLCHEGEDRNEDKENVQSKSDIGIGSKPMAVAMVHEKKEAKLRDLVTELLPAANSLVGKGHNLGTADEIVAYFRLYSLSMPNAIPSKGLAMNELPERNGLFLNPNSHDTNAHEILLEKVGGPGTCALATSREYSTTEQNINEETLKTVFHSACPSLAFVTQSPADTSTLSAQKARNVIVIGGGFIGSSIALALARRGIRVTVLDKRDINNGDVGEATKASWAWLNANDKTPWSYFSLNHFGMKVWRNDPILSDLPVWCGGLVRRTKRTGLESANASIEDDPAKGGAYASIGPLARDEVIALDPAAEFLGESPPCGEEIYFYPDEGHVDPARAIHAIRLEASRLGATFVGGIAVERTVNDDDGKVCGVITDDRKQWAADAVIVAAGIGSKDLSGLDIIRQPGMIALTKPAAGPMKETPSSDSLPTTSSREEAEKVQDLGGAPRRILVDTINEAHILQRREGELAVGGGYLQVGGVASASHLGGDGVGSKNANNDEEDMFAAAREVIKLASQVSPLAIERVEFSHAESADRPMPSDGLPAIGFCRPGLFCVVSHSGITLGPLLGELAAIEVCEIATAEDLVGDFRPTRFERLCQH